MVSEPTTGTTFTVGLPALPLESLAVKNRPSESPYSCSGIEVVGAIMEGFGFEVHRAENGAAVLDVREALLLRGESVSVFLLDSQVPGAMGGLETAHRLHLAGSEAPMIVMSGHFDSNPESTRASPDGLWRLAKPFTADELSQVVRAACS